MGSVATLLEQIGYSNVDVVGKAFFGVMICVATVKVTGIECCLAIGSACVLLVLKNIDFRVHYKQIARIHLGVVARMGVLSEDSPCTSRRVLHSSYSFCCRWHRQQRREDHLSKAASETTVQVFGLTKTTSTSFAKAATRHRAHVLTRKLETASLDTLAEVIGLMVVKSSGAKSVSKHVPQCAGQSANNNNK